MFSKLTNILTSEKKNFDGSVYIYWLLTPTLFMLGIYTTCFFYLFCTNLSMYKLLFSLCGKNFF